MVNGSTVASNLFLFGPDDQQKRHWKHVYFWTSIGIITYRYFFLFLLALFILFVYNCCCSHTIWFFFLVIGVLNLIDFGKYQIMSTIYKYPLRHLTKTKVLTHNVLRHLFPIIYDEFISHKKLPPTIVIFIFVLFKTNGSITPDEACVNMVLNIFV